MKNEILARIEEEKRDFEETFDCAHTDELFYSKMLKLNSINGDVDFNEINLVDFFAAYVAADDGLFYSDIKPYIDLNKSFIKNIKSSDEICLLMSSINILLKYFDSDDINKVLNSETLILNTNSYDDLPYVYDSISYLKDLEKQGEIDINAMIHLYELDENTLLDAFKIISKIDKFSKMDPDDLYQKVGSKKSGVKGYVTTNGDIATLFKLFDELREEFEDRKSVVEPVVKSTRKKIKNLDEAIKWLDSIDEKNEITIIPNFINAIDNISIRVDILKYIYIKNMNYYNELNKKYELLSSDNSAIYKSLFNKYGIVVEESDLNLNVETEVLEEILKNIKKFNIKDTKQILNIISISNSERINNISKLMDRGLISKDFISSNINIFDLESDDFEIINNNIEFLRENKFNKNGICNFREGLLTPNDKIVDSVTKLHSYLLGKDGINIDNISFINDDKLFNKIDLLIELGYEDILDSNLDILNYNFDNYKRLVVLNRLNMMPTDYEDIKLVLDKQKFVVSDDSIDEYIEGIKGNVSNDKKISKDEIRAFLNESITSIRSYNINGVIVSKNRVDNKLNDVCEDITYNELYSVLTSDTMYSTAEYKNLREIFIDDKILIKK